MFPNRSAVMHTTTIGSGALSGPVLCAPYNYDAIFSTNLTLTLTLTLTLNVIRNAGPDNAPDRNNTVYTHLSRPYSI